MRILTLVLFAGLAILALILVLNLPGEEQNIAESVGDQVTRDRQYLDVITPVTQGPLSIPKSPATQRQTVGSVSPEPVKAVTEVFRFIGSVNDLLGSPLQGARVSLHTGFGSRVDAPLWVTVNQYGKFELSTPVVIEGNLGIGWAYATAQVAGFRSAVIDLRVEAMIPGQTLLNEFKLEAGMTAVGMVIDEFAQPVGGAKVHYPGDDVSQPIRTRQDGRYFLSIERPGDYEINAQESGVGVGSIIASLVPSVDAALPDIVLRGPAYLSGRILLPGGGPLQDCLYRQEDRI